MIVKWKFTIFNIVCVVLTINSYILKDPSYSPDYFYSTFDSYNDLRQTYIDKRRQNRVTAKRVQLLDQYLSNDSVFVDGIIHHKINEKHVHLKQVNKIEKAFKNFIEMDGVKYTYKRDPYWRTWRKVKYPDGDKIVCYRCESNANCTNCQYGSYWVIDENPPCPFEIFSVISNEELCAINITNSTNTEKSCPTVVQSSELTILCDNPIETMWRVQKDYNKQASERYPAIICGGRDYCDISTTYLITRDYVSFRIINSTNHILYARVMKNGKQNYACVNDCGKIDPTTKVVTKTDNPLVVDLITDRNKNKRHDKTQQDATPFYPTTTAPSRGPEFYPLKSEKLKQAINKMETMFNFQQNQFHHHHDKKHPTCSSMKHILQNEFSDYE